MFISAFWYSDMLYNLEGFMERSERLDGIILWRGVRWILNLYKRE